MHDQRRPEPGTCAEGARAERSGDATLSSCPLGRCLQVPREGVNVYSKSRRSGPLPSLGTWGYTPCGVGAGPPCPQPPGHPFPASTETPSTAAPTCALSSSAVVAGPRRGAGVPVGGVPRTPQSRDPCVQPAPSSHAQPSPQVDGQHCPGQRVGVWGAPVAQASAVWLLAASREASPATCGWRGRCGVLGQTPGSLMETQR